MTKSYNVRDKHGKFTKMINGRIYKVQGVLARFQGIDRSSKQPKFRIHKNFVSTNVDVAHVSRATQNEVKQYLQNIE